MVGFGLQIGGPVGLIVDFGSQNGGFVLLMGLMVGLCYGWMRWCF